MKKITLMMFMVVLSFAVFGHSMFTDTIVKEYLLINLDEGTYAAGVQSVCTTGSSEIVNLDFDRVFGVDVLVNVTTNSGDSPEGADVTLTNQEMEQYEYTATADEDGDAHFEMVRKGIYIIHISLPLHHSYVAEDVDIQDDFTYYAELTEIIEEPYGLMVDTENVDEGEALLSWNNAITGEVSFSEDGITLQDGDYQASMISEDKEREFRGFNVFLNDDSSSIGSMGTSYMFTNVPAGTHVAGVQSVYTSGTSEIITIEFEMEAPDEQFARAQIIHNSADETVSLVDIYVNGEMFLSDVGFRQATAFMDVPAAVDLEIHITRAGEGIKNAVGQFELNLTPYETYIIVASGNVGETDNPDAAFNLFVYDRGREASQNVSNTDVSVFHGVTDAPAVTIFEQTIDNELMLVEYGEFSDYLPLPAQDFILEIRDADGIELIATFEAPLASMGYESEAIVIVASGFLNSDNNNAAFGLWLAEVEGGALIELDIFVNVDEMSMFDNKINMFPNPANNIVNLQSASVMTEIKMIDMSGHVVYSENIDSDTHQFDARQFNNGVYIIQVVTTDGMFMDKLQIQS